MKSNRHLVKFSSLLVLLLLLAACGSSEPTPAPIGQTPIDQPGGNTISGTVTAPTGGDIGGTEIGACPVVNNAPDCTNVVSLVVTQSGSSAAYSLDAQAGQSYVVFAYKDTNNSGGDADNGDYLGGYPTVESPTAVTAPATNIDFALAVVGGSTPSPSPTPSPVPNPPSGGNSISGTVFAIDQATPVFGTVVAACPYVGSSPDCENLVFVELNASAPSAAYSLDNLNAGQYAVVAIQDYDGDGTYESEGAYAQPVTPPATGIDIQLAPAGTANFGVLNVDELVLEKFNSNKLQKLLE